MVSMLCYIFISVYMTINILNLEYTVYFPWNNPNGILCCDFDTKGRDEPLFTKYIIKTSNTSPTKNPSSTPKQPGANVSTAKPQTPATDGLSCSINPSIGTILTQFLITCKTESPCPKCRYCFKAEGRFIFFVCFLNYCYFFSKSS